MADKVITFQLYLVNKNEILQTPDYKTVIAMTKIKQSSKLATKIK